MQQRRDTPEHVTIPGADEAQAAFADDPKVDTPVKQSASIHLIGNGGIFDMDLLLLVCGLRVFLLRKNP